LKKRITIIVILVLVFIIGIVIYTKTNYKRISDIGGFQNTDITKILFQYNNGSIKAGTIENKEKIGEFMSYINNCVFSKKLFQTSITGYYQMLVFHVGDKEVMRIMAYDNFMDINGIQYNMVKNKLSLKKIDNLINNINK